MQKADFFRLCMIMINKIFALKFPIQTLFLCCCIVSLIACGDAETSSESSSPVMLELASYAQDSFTFSQFDQEEAMEEMIELPGVTVYRGSLHTFDYIKTEVYVALNPAASVNRILFAVNGDVGADPRNSLQAVSHDHKVLFLLSQRGLHPEDLKHECSLGVNFVTCLKSTPNFAKFNPKDNGKDLLDLMRIVKGEIGAIELDGKVAAPAALFGELVNGDDAKFNVHASSHGATILAYALAQTDIARIQLGRVFLNGPSSPSKNVVTDGLKNNRVVMENFMNAIAMDDNEKTAFLNVLRARHRALNPDCHSAEPTEIDSNATVTRDCLTSGMIWRYMFTEYSSASSESELMALKATLLNIPASEVRGDSALANQIVPVYLSDALDSEARSKRTWESSNSVSLLTDTAGHDVKYLGLSQRTAQICSSYINRSNGDSRSAFDTARSENDPYWYGLLIRQHVFLDICPDIVSESSDAIEAPSASSVAVNAELLVQFGAGLDDMHNRAGIEELASYFSESTPKVEVYMPAQLQHGGGFRFGNCMMNVAADTFGSGADASAAHAAVMATRISTDMNSGCGLSTQP